MVTCEAKTRSGALCKGRAMPNGRCRMHGGKSLAGLASPTIKSGRYSKYLPARLMGRYEEALADDELLALREEIALVDARLADLIGRVDTGESGHLWHLLRSAYKDLEEAQRARDTVAAALALTELGNLIKRGMADYAAWGEIASVLEQRRRLVESERKRLVDMQQMITTQQAMTLIAALTDIINRHVTDRDTRAAISTELIRLTARNASHQPATGGDE